jgi:hypothetical protein
VYPETPVANSLVCVGGPCYRTMLALLGLWRGIAGLRCANPAATIPREEATEHP